MKKCEVCKEEKLINEMSFKKNICKKCTLASQKEDMSKRLCPWMTSGPKQLVYCKLGECMAYMESNQRAFCLRLKDLLTEVGY